MPRSWSEAKKNCPRHPKKDKRGRWCRCDGPGWRYRMGLPDPSTGGLSKPAWSKTFDTKELADAHQIETRKAIKAGKFASDRGKTLEDYLLEWLEAKRIEQLSPNTLGDYRSKVTVHLIPHLGNLRLGSLRTLHVQAMMNKIASTPSAKTGRPVEPVTLAGILRAIRTALEDAVRLQLIAQNWAAHVKLPEVRAKKPVDIGREAAATFIRHIQGERQAAMWLMLALYPTRRSEIIGLRWPDLDPAARQFEIRQALTRPKGNWPCPFCPDTHSYRHFGPPKTKAGERPIPLIAAVDLALQEHRKRQDVEREAHGSDYRDHQLVFCERDGLPLPPDNVTRAFVVRMRQAGIIGEGERASLKSLRSSAVTALHEAGTDMEVITAVAGHRPDGEVTRKHYLDAKAERARAPFEAIAAALLKAEGKAVT